MQRLVLADTVHYQFELVRDAEPIAEGAQVTAVELRLRPLEGGSVVTAAGSIAVEADGDVVATVTLGSGDFYQTGEWRGELVLTLADGEVRHSEEPIDLYVRPEYERGPR